MKEERPMKAEEWKRTGQFPENPFEYGRCSFCGGFMSEDYENPGTYGAAEHRPDCAWYEEVAE